MGFWDTLGDVVKTVGPVVIDAVSDKKGASAAPKVSSAPKGSSKSESGIDSDTINTVVDFATGVVKNAKLTEGKAQSKISKAFGKDDHCDLQDEAAKAIANAFKDGLTADEKKMFNALKKQIGKSMKDGNINADEVSAITQAIGDLNKAAGVSR